MLSNRRGLISTFLPILLVAVGLVCLVYAGWFHVVTTELASPETTEPVLPESTEPASPETTEPALPESAEPALLESAEPPSPETTEPASPESTELVFPESSEPISPETPWPGETPDLENLFGPEAFASIDELLPLEVTEPTLIRQVTRGEVTRDASGTIKQTPAEDPDQPCPT